MPIYNGSLTQADIEFRINQASAQLLTALNNGFDQYKKWYDLTYGLTTAQIATLFSITTNEATDLQSAFNVFNDLNSFMNNLAVTQNDRLTTILKFI